MEKNVQQIKPLPMLLVKVIIPVYRPILSPMEKASILETINVLHRYPIIILHPEGMSMANIPGKGKVNYMPVSDTWLGARNGIAGYNQMMLSREFYQLFNDTEYLLICHTDAWIFRDELEDWCKKGYDCIAAPWVKRPVYTFPIIKQYMKLLARYKAHKGIFCRQQLYGKIGNGGLSLRRTKAFIEACTSYAEEIKAYKGQKKHYFNEDVFWATIPTEFNYPTEEEALRFSFDRHPDYCMKLNDRQLPFGCHSWTKPRMYRFWKKIINWQKLL